MNKKTRGHGDGETWRSESYSPRLLSRPLPASFFCLHPLALPSVLSLRDLGERDGECGGAERLHERGLLGVEVADPVNHGRVLLFRFDGGLLNRFGRNLLGLFGRDLLLPAAEKSGESRTTAPGA